MIYLDHAATSWPKPAEVLRAVTGFLRTAGGNPGRSGHRLSIAAGRIVYEAREAVAGLFGAPDPLKVVFTPNATQAINLVLHGLLRPGDKVVCSGIEHNAVMRPLRELEGKSCRSTLAPMTAESGPCIRLHIVPCRPDGTADLSCFERAITPDTRLVVVNHASNVSGSILPVAEIAMMARRAGALLLLDAAQTAGLVPIDVSAMDVGFLAFTGHKGLHGPPGTGGLIVGERVDVRMMRSLVQGGTGSRSEQEFQPERLPDKFESGTLNGAGIAGLGAGVRWVAARGIETIQAKGRVLTQALLEGLGNIRGVRLHGTQDPEARLPTVSFTIEGRSISEIGSRLDDEYGVLCRVGLHCAPAAHRTLGTFPKGTVRFAAGASSTLREARAAIAAVERIAST